MWRGIIEEFRRFLPVTENTPSITLGEGGTPLVRARNLERTIGFKGEIWLKCEGANPTGSFKDRGMVVAVAKAMEEGTELIICASTGNTAAAAAAYCAAADIKCVVFVPEGGIAKGKLAQMHQYGAKVIQVRANFDETLKLTQQIAENDPAVTIVNSTNPDRIEGQKTAAFEICEVLGEAPDYHFIPVGNAGNITAYWRGYKEYAGRCTCGRSDCSCCDTTICESCSCLTGLLPRMMGYQAAGAAPIVRGKPVKNPKTFASAIRIGNPASWQGALDARDESGGVIESVTDRQIRAAYKMIPALSGVYCEPASAASVAGLIKALRKGQVTNTEETVVVCTLTGNGLKDPDSAMEAMGEPIVVDADPEKVAKLLAE